MEKNMNVYDAMMKAADHIEANPRDFDFNSIYHPDGCGTPGCALGWVGHFLGPVCASGFSWVDATARALGVAELEFYDRMNALDGGMDWTDTATNCATTLRAYANKYHKDTNEPAPPNWNEWAMSLAGHENVVPIRSAA